MAFEGETPVQEKAATPEPAGSSANTRPTQQTNKSHKKRLCLIAAGGAFLSILCFALAWLVMESFLAQNRVVSFEPSLTSRVNTPLQHTQPPLNPNPSYLESPSPSYTEPHAYEYEITLHAKNTLSDEEQMVALIRDTQPLSHLKESPNFVKHRSPVSVAAGIEGRIAIVLDDMGVHETHTQQALETLPPEITFAFLPYGAATTVLSKVARQQGHEIMVHLPMEPHANALGHVPDPGPGALFVRDDEATLYTLTEKNLMTLKDLAVGVNNHMGSRMTEDYKGMRAVLRAVQDQQMFFLDSVTTSHSMVARAGKDLALPLLARDVFLDHDINTEQINAALKKAERIAKQKGYVIAIGHPHPETVAAINAWRDSLPEKKLQLVPITSLIAYE